MYQNQAPSERNQRNNLNHNFLKIKYLRVNLIKEIQDLYNKNFKTSKNKLKKTLENGNTANTHRTNVK